MGIFRRLFRVAEAETNAAIDKLEDPIKLTEQGIRDLKKDLQESLQSLAQANAVLIGVKKESEQSKQVATDYEKKAILLLKKAESGAIEPAEADRLATEALSKKEQAMGRAVSLAQDLQQHEALCSSLESNVNKLKHNISKWENELTTLRARAKVASASKKLNKQLSQVDASGTLAMLEKMKTKVTEDEALAQSYGQIAAAETSVDDEIDKALSSGSSGGGTSASLEALKARLRESNG